MVLTAAAWWHDDLTAARVARNPMGMRGGEGPALYPVSSRGRVRTDARPSGHPLVGACTAATLLLCHASRLSPQKQHRRHAKKQVRAARVGTCGAGAPLPCSASRHSQQRRRRRHARRWARAAGCKDPPSDGGAWPAPTPAELALLAAEAQGVPAVDGRGLEGIDRSRPLRLCGLTDSWPARTWDRRALLASHGGLRFRLRPCSTLHEYGYPGPAEAYVTLREYVAEGTASRDAVLFENDFHAAHRVLGGGYNVPGVLSGVHGRPIFSAGRRHTGIGFHRHEENWLAQLQGRKAWFLLPAGAERPPTLPPWQYLRERPEGLLCCVLEPGEILFVPSYWWHATWNLDDLTLALGWEGGASREWPQEMHAIADGDLEALSGQGLESGHEVTPEMLELAARSGHEDILQCLLSRRGDVLLREHAGTAAVAAARGGHLAVLELLLGMGCGGVLESQAAVTFPDGVRRGDAPLHEAACCGQLEAARWLLDRRADARAQDAVGREPLHLAALHGQPGIVSALLAAAADPGAVHARGSTPLAQAAFNGHSAVVELLLAAGAPVAARDALGMTALLQAALRGNAAVAGMLLAAGADPAVRDSWCRTALHLAAGGYVETDASAVPDAGFPTAPDANLAAVRTLLRARADPQAEDAEGRLPVEYAAARSHMKVAALLSECPRCEDGA